MAKNLFDKGKIQEIREEIKQIYLCDPRPWVIGYSGGKDSTLVLQLVYESLLELEPQQRKKHIYVITSDTLVENPLIITYIDKALSFIDIAARKQKLPITTHKVMPELRNTFWVNLIGRGYPSPRQHFRWCTDRLKIEPTNNFIKERINEFGEVIVVLGVRKAESSSRARVIESHRIENRILRRHTTLINAYVYAPIEELTTQSVWDYLLNTPSPWGIDHKDLYNIYQDSAAEPVFMLDKSSPATGNSRFGCWTCTVVVEDKALVGLIENDNAELYPLLIFRDWLYIIRDEEDKREKKRVNGQIYYVGEGENRHVGLGPFTLETRKEILRRLLITQKTLFEDKVFVSKYGRKELISIDELKLIDQIWIERGNWESSVPQIWKEIIGTAIDWVNPERPLFPMEDIKFLKELSEENNIPIDLLHKLLKIEEKHFGYSIKRGLYSDINTILNEQWLHHENEVSSDDY